MSTFDPVTLEKRLVELEEQMNSPGFWDDQSTAAKVSADHARTSRKLEGYRNLLRDYDDARELSQMDGGEMDDSQQRYLPVGRRGREAVFQEQDGGRHD